MDDWKIKIAVLWLFYEVAFLADMVLGFMEPGAIEQIMAGEIGDMQIGPELLLLFAIILLVPLVMAFLSLTLKDSTNRWVNIIVGIVFTGLMLIALIELLTQPAAFDTIDAFKSCCWGTDCLVRMEVQTESMSLTNKFQRISICCRMQDWNNTSLKDYPLLP